MQHFFLILVGFLFGTIIYNTRESQAPFYDRIGNQSIPLEIDCALRAFTVEMAVYLAPTASKVNWTALTRDALQMNRCSGTFETGSQPSSSAKPFQTAPHMQRETCHHTVFVHDQKGNDLFDGTFENPMKTIQAALFLTRSLRGMYGSGGKLCMTIRGGTYYLGTNATTTSSQIGAIALTSNDSNLVIENYPGETVVLSGGTLLQLQWSVHVKTAMYGTIMKAQVPDSVNPDEFNELFIDGKRAIVAKYPNGDPSTQGLYADNPGYSFDADSWLPATRHNRSTDIVVESVQSQKRYNFSLVRFK